MNSKSKVSSNASSHGSEGPVQTFWTRCPNCKMLFQYSRVYLNLNLRCRNCNKAFRAVEIAPPPAHHSNPWATWHAWQQYCQYIHDLDSSGEVMDSPSAAYSNGNGNGNIEKEGQHSPMHSRSSDATSSDEESCVTMPSSVPDPSFRGLNNKGKGESCGENEVWGF